MDDVKSFNGVPNVKTVDGKKFFNCVMCGACCHIREKDKGISLEDEEKYRSYMYSKFGIIYLARLSDITINVWPEEAERLKEEAKSRKIELKIVPKRAVYDRKAHELIILDYYIDHDICPFYKEKLCTAYNIRPIICRSYPLLTTKDSGKCKYKIDSYDSEMIEARKLELMIHAQKRIIQSMIEREEIEVPESLEPVELDNIFRTARFKELRMMEKVLKDK